MHIYICYIYLAFISHTIHKEVELLNKQKIHVPQINDNSELSTHRPGALQDELWESAVCHLVTSMGTNNLLVDNRWVISEIRVFLILVSMGYQWVG